MSGIRTAWMRGGTSKGALFLASDLPPDPAERDRLLLRIMGSPDVRQVDGLGGGHPLTSKVGVVSPSEHPAADVDYLFLQVMIEEPVVTDAQTCGNILAAVGPFALTRGLVAAADGVSEVRVRMVNTGTLATLRVRTPGGEVTYDGEAAMSGVPGTAAPVEIVLEAGEGPLFPTGRVREQVAGLEATLVDNGMPSVLVRAADLGVSGTEAPPDLEERLGDRVREIRAAALPLLGLDETATSLPKIVLLSPPTGGGTIHTRSFLPVRVHQAVGVLGAASIAAACRQSGTIVDTIVNNPVGAQIRIEHPTGFLDLTVTTDTTDGDRITGTAVVRTARMLMDGTVYPGPARTAAPSAPDPQE